LLYYFISKKKSTFVDLEDHFNIDLAAGIIRDSKDDIVEAILKGSLIQREEGSYVAKPPKKEIFPFEKELRNTPIYRDYIEFCEFLYFEIKQLKEHLKNKDIEAIRKSILKKKAIARENEYFLRRFQKKLTDDEKMFLKYVYYSRLLKGKCPYCGSTKTRWRYSDKTVRLCLKCKCRFRIVPKGNIPYYKIGHFYKILDRNG
jgi:hypothetical protein